MQSKIKTLKFHLYQVGESETKAKDVVDTDLCTVENAKEYFDTLFAEYDEEKCKSISREERESKELVNKSLVYGEVIFETVEQILSVVSF